MKDSFLSDNNRVTQLAAADILRTELFTWLDRHHLKPTKELGQHYLIDPEVLASILKASDIKEDELVLEIGAGPGVLTKALAESGAEVLAVEYDRDFCRLLQDRFHNWRNIHVLCDDALRIDLNTLNKDQLPYRKVVANLPYQITNPLVRNIIAPDSPITEAILLVQKEVAQRLTAPVGSSDRGILTLMVEAYGTAEIVTVVPAKAFWPAPKVESAVMRLVRRQSEPGDNQAQVRTIEEEKALFWLIKQGFSGKRKTLANALSAGLRLTKAEATAMIVSAGVDAGLRAEDIDLAGWRSLLAAFQEKFGATANLTLKD